MNELLNKIIHESWNHIKHCERNVKKPKEKVRKCCMTE